MSGSSLESLVPSLSLCRQLQTAGFPQDTAFSWYPITPAEETIDSNGIVTGREPEKGDKTEFLFQSGECDDALCAAPTAGEMEEWLSVNNLRRFITIYYEPYEPTERRWSVASDLAKKPEPNLSTCRAATLVAALAALVLEVAG
jgi:hypothetical protein